jgi:hypothetical protein
MTNEYVYVTGQDGEVYEICPSDALVGFLQRLAEEEVAEEEASVSSSRAETRSA